MYLVAAGEAAEQNPQVFTQEQVLPLPALSRAALRSVGSPPFSSRIFSSLFIAAMLLSVSPDERDLPRAPQAVPVSRDASLFLKPAFLGRTIARAQPSELLFVCLAPSPVTLPEALPCILGKVGRGGHSLFAAVCGGLSQPPS